PQEGAPEYGEQRNQFTGFPAIDQTKSGRGKLVNRAHGLHPLHVGPGMKSLALKRKAISKRDYALFRRQVADLGATVTDKTLPHGPDDLDLVRCELHMGPAKADDGDAASELENQWTKVLNLCERFGLECM